VSALRSRVDRLDGGSCKPIDRMSDGELWRIVRRRCSLAQLSIIESGSTEEIDALLRSIAQGDTPYEH
jgi:hypothetical protein